MDAAAKDPPHADGAGDQQDTQRQGPGQAEGVHHLGEEEGVLSPQGVLHGDIDARSGYQWENGDEQVDGNRALAHPGHGLRVDGQDQRGHKIGHHFAPHHGQGQQVGQPPRRAPQ